MAEDAAGGGAGGVSSAPPPPQFQIPPGVKPEDLIAFSLDSRQATLLVAGMATLIASHLCLNVITEHVKHWRRDREQRAIIALLFMVPVFAIDAYFGLADMPGSEVAITVLDSVRACYEAFVISEFLALLFSYVGISTAYDAPVPDTVKGTVLHNSFPLTLILPQDMFVDRKTVNLLLLLSRQFVLVRPVFSVLQCALLLLGVYHSSPLVPLLFLAVFNVSMYLAFYALLLFYHAFEKQLQKHKPLAKFLCIKGVVFLVFWQGLIVRGLVSYGVIHAGQMPYEVRQVEESVQNFVVCIEMLIFTFAFQYAYSASEYEHLSPQGAQEPPPSRPSQAKAPGAMSAGPTKKEAAATDTGTSAAPAKVEGKKEK